MPQPPAHQPPTVSDKENANMPRILITSTSFGKRVKGPLETLLAKGYDLKFNDLGRPLSPEELIERLADCDGCIAGLDYFTAEVFAAAEKLRIVSRYGSGVDRVDLDEVFGDLWRRRDPQWVVLLPGDLEQRNCWE